MAQRLVGNGDCFKVAGEMVVHNKCLTLCHAKVMGQGDIAGICHWHARCELQDVVIDYSNGDQIVMRRENYYKIAQITEQDIRRYNRMEAMRLMLRHKHYGTFPEEKRNHENENVVRIIKRFIKDIENRTEAD